MNSAGAHRSWIVDQDRLWSLTFLMLVRSVFAISALPETCGAPRRRSVRVGSSPNLCVSRERRAPRAAAGMA